MKKVVIFLVCILLVSCQPKKSFDATTVALTSECPEKVNCDIKILTGKSMVVTPAGSNTTYTLQDSNTKNVVLYKYDKIVKGNLQDAGYREEIVFELDKNSTVINLSGEQLQNTKMLFGRFCYCKGQTGYYEVKNGIFSIDANHNADLNFSVSEVPQITKHIRFSLK